MPFMCPRFAPPGIGLELQDERYPTDRKVGPRSVAVGYRYAKGGGPSPAYGVDPDRVATLRAQAPAWSTGRQNPGFGGMGMTVPYPGR